MKLVLRNVGPHVSHVKTAENQILKPQTKSVGRPKIFGANCGHDHDVSGTDKSLCFRLDVIQYNKQSI